MSEQASTSDRQAERRYDHDELREQARNLFGVSPHLVAGALVGAKQKPTEAEAQKLVDKFAKHKDSTTVEEESE